MRAATQCSLAFYSSAGLRVAEVTIIPFRAAGAGAQTPLVQREVGDADTFGETEFQLREGERYEYTVLSNLSLQLRSSLATPLRARNASGISDAGIIETGTFCGTLLLELVERGSSSDSVALASQLIDVRSVKLDFRTEYRGMLRRVADEAVALLLDARSSVKSPFTSAFSSEASSGGLQLQLELLRHLLDAPEFAAAVNRITNYPHERLSTTVQSASANRSQRLAPSAVRQLIRGSPRTAVPGEHPIRIRYGLESIAKTVSVIRRDRSIDTAENRFIKFALLDMRSFLSHALAVFSSSSHRWGALGMICSRLSTVITEMLERPFFQEIGDLNQSPLGSVVLQRRGGYREVLNAWLRFRSASELSWQGGQEVFRGGQRNVALLYEYWLFFVLLDLFCRMFRGGERPPANTLLDGLAGDSPQLKLKEGEEIGPFEGKFVSGGRVMRARFSYNRAYSVSDDRSSSGSWTRRMRPDYTLSFWPDAFSEAQAEERELLVHVHFDAKYRVEGLNDLFGADDEVDEATVSGAQYRYADLLKMHAYRDAIRRTQGAFILYPGRDGAQRTFRGFTHEILPGVGAFAIAPDDGGAAQGIDEFEMFISELLAHLSNRTTAQERVAFHVGEAYQLREGPVYYGDLRLGETDELSDRGMALPPDEHHVVVAWIDSAEQQKWTDSTGLVVLRLGDRPGTWKVPPEIASARHVLLRSHGNNVVPGLRRLLEPGYAVFGVKDLQAHGYPGRAGGEIYAVFKTAPDPLFAGHRWDGFAIRDLLIEFEARRSYRRGSLGRQSPDPRVLSLRTLLKSIGQNSVE